MKIKEFVVKLCEREEIKGFIETYHYSKSINGLKSSYCFKLIYNNEIIGAMIFGKLAMKGVWKKYCDDENKLIELRRLCCIDDTPKNTESYFIGKCLKWLKNNTDIEYIISYADMDYNHKGIIYKATNFDYIGKTKKGRRIVYNDKLYHDKTIRTKYKGKLKPYAQRIKNSLEDGSSYYIESKGKYIYLYKIRRRNNVSISK